MRWRHDETALNRQSIIIIISECDCDPKGFMNKLMQDMMKFILQENRIKKKVNAKQNIKSFCHIFCPISFTTSNKKKGVTISFTD